MAAAGDKVRASDVNRTIGFVQVTSAQGSITTETDLTSLTFTWTAVSGRYYEVTAFAPFLSTVAGDVASVKLTDGANTRLQQDGVALPNASPTTFMGKIIWQSNSLSGSTTVKLRCVRSVGTGTITMNAAATLPATLHVKDVT